jgi:hypothetical protein
LNFASFNFFLFLVRRYSVGSARAPGRKLLVASGFGRAGGVILPEYGLGGGTVFIAGEAKLGPRRPTNDGPPAADVQCF